MNKLSIDRQSQIIKVLCEGNSIRSIARIPRTPATAAGVSDRSWLIEDIVKLADSNAERR